MEDQVEDQVEELVDSESDPDLMGDLEVQVDPLVERKLESEPGRQAKWEHQLDITESHYQYVFKLYCHREAQCNKREVQ